MLSSDHAGNRHVRFDERAWETERYRMAKSHHDKIALVSGGANGIGQEFAQRLAQDGAHVVIADIAPGGDTARMVEQAGRRALVCSCDVSSVDAVKMLASDVTKQFGRCDILVNCAGIFPNQPFDEMTFADWRRVLAINLDSVFLMSSAFVPGMKQRGWGRIVNMASSTLGSVVSGFVHDDAQSRLLDLLKPGGILVSSAAKPDESRAKALGVRAVAFVVDVNRGDLQKISPMFETKALRADIGAVLPLEQSPHCP
jgi:hypothetical protein